MRLSGSILVTLLSVSATLVAQHTSGTISSASFSEPSISGGSHSYSGGSASSSSSASSHSSSNYAPHSSGTNAMQSAAKPATLSSSKENANQEKRIGRSFWHPFRTAVVNGIARCVKEPCPACPLGESRSAGACVVTANACPAGWNSFTCGSQYQQFNDCNALASQLKAEEQHMRGVETGPDLIHQMLLKQYQQCMVRFGGMSLSSYLFDDTRLADVTP